MNLHHPIFESVALPLVLALVVTGLARAVLGPGRGGLAATLGVGIAIIGATLWMSGIASAPSSTLARLPWVFIAATVAGLAAAAASARPFAAWLVGAVVAVAALGWLGGVRGAINGAIGAILLAGLMRAPVARADAVTALVVAGLGLAAASFIAGSLALFQHALLLAAAAGGAALWLWPKSRLSFGHGATVATTVAWLATAQAASQGIAIGPVTVALLAAALLAGFLTAGRRREPPPYGGGGFQPSAVGRAAFLRPLATAALALMLVVAGIGWQIYGVRFVPAGDSASPAGADDPYVK